MNENLKYWLALNKVEGLGPVKTKKLYEQYKSARAICEALNCKIPEIENELKSLEGEKARAVTIEDESYPDNLRNIYDPPGIIYIKGELLKTDRKAIAIVGTRRATRYGLEVTRKLASQLAEMGVTIISGLALGIDTAAHEGALHSKGRTAAVLGSGVDQIFPQSNQKLAARIEENGAIISEFPLGQKPESWTFPQRNRIISGLSLGVIVVEGHYDSGAMITAKLALEQGREVFAVPGNIELDQSKGPHWLIKQGAKLVESVEDVLEELKAQIPVKMTNVQSFDRTQDKYPMSNEGKNYSNLSEEERKVVSVLSLEPKHIDSISIETGLPIPQVSSLLMMLEIKRAVRQLPGKMFVLY